MTSGAEWGWWNERQRAVLAHAIGFLGANLVGGMLTLLLLHVVGRALAWTLPASLELFVFALGAACMLAGAVLLTPRRAGKAPATPRPPSSLLSRDDKVGSTAPRRFVRKGS
jgi:hypothetical protein